MCLRENRPEVHTDLSGLLEHNYIAFFFHILKLFILHTLLVSNLSWTEVLTNPDCLTNSGKLSSSIQFQLHCETHQIQRGTPEVEVVVTEEKKWILLNPFSVIKFKLTVMSHIAKQ